jgi:hypothetical protein
MYMMMGTMLRPFGRFYPVLVPIGDNLKSLSTEASEAWIELAQQDKKVQDALEAITGASTWGNVIGIHLAIFASAIPGAAGSYMQQVSQSEDGGIPEQFVQYARQAGIEDKDIPEAYQEYMAMMGSAGTTDTVRAQPHPEQQAQAQETPPPVTGNNQARSGIVSPDELGVENPGDENVPFPADTTAPNGR